MQQRHRFGGPAALAAVLLIAGTGIACSGGTGREQAETPGADGQREFTGAFGDSAIAEPLPEPSDPAAGATANPPEPAPERPPLAGTSDTAPMAPSLPGVVDTAPMGRAGPGVVDTAMATPMVDPRTRWRPLGGTLDTAAVPVSRPERATIPARTLPGVHR